VFQKHPRRLVSLVAALLLPACGEESTGPDASAESVADYVASVLVDDTSAALSTDGVPRPSTDGPSITVDGHLTIVNGGTATMSISSPTPFATVYVAASSPVSPLFTPVGGYYEVSLPEPTGFAEVLITFPQTLPTNDFDLYFSAADAQGNVGTLADRKFEALAVGTGDVQVTVSWDTNSDVDLHVVDPNGWEIYWGSTQSPSGGRLDLDSNVACAIDGVRNENITWDVGTAPSGMYTVRVDYWSACGVNATNYTVLVNNGGEIEIFRGTFSGSGDGGGIGSGVEVTTFTRGTAPAGAPPVVAPVLVQPPGPATKEVLR